MISGIFNFIDICRGLGMSDENSLKYPYEVSLRKFETQVAPTFVCHSLAYERGAPYKLALIVVLLLPMAQLKISGGTVHKMPADLGKALVTRRAVYAAWEDLTPLARNEWICWVTFPKKEETRREHVRRAINELMEGKRRPCCWIGCIHRTDKTVSPSVRAVLDKRKKTKGKRV